MTNGGRKNYTGQSGNRSENFEDLVKAEQAMSLPDGFFGFNRPCFAMHQVMLPRDDLLSRSGGKSFSPQIDMDAPQFTPRVDFSTYKSYIGGRVKLVGVVSDVSFTAFFIQRSLLVLPL